MIRNFILYFKHPHSRVIGLSFFSMSVLFGSWITRIPEVQEKLDLSESKMGLALLAMSAGAFIISPLAGFLFTKTDIPKSIIIGAISMSVALLLPIIATSFAGLCIALFLLGLANGFLNIAINTAAAAFEKSSERTIMSTCHGMFSFGAMTGAGIGSLIVGAGVPGSWHFGGVCLFIILLTFINRRRLLQLKSSQVENSVISWPPRVLWVLIFIALCAMLAEGVVADWGGIYLEKTLRANGYLLGLGFAGFSGFMAVGRFMGDSIIPRVGSKIILRWGLLIGIAGLAIAVGATWPWMAIIGFSLSGLGFSVVVPIVFSAAANVPGIAPSEGIAAVAGIGVLGFLGGPPLIGFIAEHTSMRFGIMLTVVFALLAFFMAFLNRERGVAN